MGMVYASGGGDSLAIYVQTNQNFRVRKHLRFPFLLLPNLYPIPNPAALVFLVEGRVYPTRSCVRRLTLGNLVPFPNEYFNFEGEPETLSNVVRSNDPRPR